MPMLIDNANGTDYYDDINYDKSGEYHLGKGLDSVRIMGGTVIVHADQDNKYLLVMGGENHKIYGGAGHGIEELVIGKDEAYVGNATVDAELGSGKDKIKILRGSGRKSDGTLCQLRGGAWGDSFDLWPEAQNYQLFGEAGDDSFTIRGGSNLICWGGAANDSFYVSGGTGIKLRGGDSDDTYDINAPGVDMQLGYGRDIVYVNSGDNQVIKANLGINNINIMAGSGHVITADIDQAASRKQGYTEAQIKNGEGVGYGVDNVYIDGANQVTAHLGDGRDYVQLQDTRGCKIYTEGWNDAIDVNGGSINCVVNSGAGDDLITVQGGSTSYIFGDAGNDLITVKGGSSNYIYGGAGNDHILVTGGQSSVYGGEGKDIIEVLGETKEIDGGEGNDKIYISSSNPLTVTCGSDARDYIWIDWDKLIKGTNVIRNDGKLPTAGARDRILLYGASLSYKNFAMGITAGDNGTVMLSDGNKNLFIRDFNNNYITELSFQNSSLLAQDKAVRVMLDNVWATKPLGSYAVENLVSNPAGLEVADPFKQENLSDLIKASMSR